MQDNNSGLDRSRRGFLRQLGGVMAAGIGLTVLPAAARASSRDSTSGSANSPDTASGSANSPEAPTSLTCCVDTSCGSCVRGKVKYRCQGTCPQYCTGCQSVSCYSIPC
jgi:hypothetical protein